MCNDGAEAKKIIESAREEASTLEAIVEVIERTRNYADTQLDPKDQVDALGHLRLAYNKAALLSAQGPKDAYEALEYETAQKAYTIAKENGTSNMPIAIVHLAGVIIAQESKKSNEAVDINKIKSVLNQVTEAIEVFPGSKAHKAWPALSKARLEMLLSDYGSAEKTLRDGYLDLETGRIDEMSKDSNGQLRLDVWRTGLKLGEAELYLKRGKPDIAINLANEIIEEAKDPNKGYLSARSNQAKELIASIK